MKSHQAVNSEISNKVGAKMYLEFTVHLIEYGYFNPIVFCHDKFWFDRPRYSEIMIGFFNLLSFLYSCGITVETKLLEPNDHEIVLYSQIMRDDDLSSSIKSYVLQGLDLTGLNIQNAKAPETCRDEDFAFVEAYLLLNAGSALTKKSFDHIFGKSLTDTEALSVRKIIQNITGRKIEKRKDNSYEMR